METIQAPVAFVGGGNMARAIVAGAVEAGALDPARVCVGEPVAQARAWFESRGCAVAPDGGVAVRWLAARERTPGEGAVVLAVKPQMLHHAAAQVTPALGGIGRTVVTILAGTPSAKVRDALAGAPVRIVRAMPNTPASIRRGITALAQGADATERDVALAERLFAGVGRVLRIDEELMDAFTAVAGSGPAYVFYLAEAMTEAAIAAGFDRSTALLAVRATVAGAGALLEARQEDPAALRAAVTSKAGTTAAATAVLDAAGAREAIVRAVIAARDRGRELAEA